MLPFGNTVITLDQDLVLNICVSKVWFQSLQGFLRRRLKYEKLTDDRNQVDNSLQSARKEENTIAGFK